MGRYVMKILVVVACIGVFSSSVNAEDLIERKYDITGVSQLLASGAGDLSISLGETESLVVTAPQSIIEKIKVVGKGDRLHIKQAGGKYRKGNYPISYVLNIKRLTSANLAGSLKVSMNSEVRNDSFDLNLAGSVEMTIPSMVLNKEFRGNIRGAANLTIENLSCAFVELHALGASKVKFVGRVQKQQVNLTGAVEYFAEGLDTKEANLHLTGASNAKVAVSQSLVVNMKGASHVSYYGDPKVEQKNLGASSVKRLGPSALDTK